MNSRGEAAAPTDIESDLAHRGFRIERQRIDIPPRGRDVPIVATTHGVSLSACHGVA